MKRFTVICPFGSEHSPFHIYVGEPAPNMHPLFFQSTWLAEKRGGTVPEEVMSNFAKLHQIALDNKVSFEELCAYALGTQTPPAEVPSTASEEKP